MNMKTIKLLTYIVMSIGMAFSAQAQAASGLDARQQAIAIISAFTARGDMDKLKAEFENGLDSGLSINEIKEVLVQMYAYCGFPRSLNALNLFMTTVEERKAAGKTDEVGKEATPLDNSTDMYELGEEVRTALVGRPVTGKVYDFCPVIDEYLRSHLFGAIFARDNLNHENRELATVGALAGMNLESRICPSAKISVLQKRNFVDSQPLFPKKSVVRRDRLSVVFWTLYSTNNKINIQ